MNPDKMYQLLCGIFGQEYEVRSGEFRINCFRCDDATGNLEISLDKGIFHCWKCNYSGKLVRLLKDYLGYLPNIDEYVSPDDLRRFSPEVLFQKEGRKPGEFLGLPEEYISLTSDFLTYVGRKALRYVLSRMTEGDVENYQIGYCGLGKYKWRVIIPVIEDGRPVYFIARTFMGESPTYKNPEKEEVGIGKEEVVFNLGGKASREDGVVICEGVFDAIRVGDAGVAIFGTSLSDIQMFKLLEVSKKFIILLDGDRPGIEGAIKMAHKLLSLRNEVCVVVPPKGDPSDWSNGEISQWLSQAKPFNSNQEIRLKLLYI